jgi:hypothetical protein
MHLDSMLYLLVAEGDGSVVVRLVDLGSLEHQLVDDGGGDATEDRGQPVEL